ncbi:S8 family serine peptidase [Promicromonospora soli]
MNRSRYLGALAALALAAGGVTAQGLAAQGATAGLGASAIDPIAPVHEIPSSVDTTLVNETKGSWFVELESEPASSGTDAKTLTAERQDFRAAAKDAGVDYSVRRAFHTLFNGYSINMDSTQLGRLQRTEGVKAIYPMTQIEIPETLPAGNEPDLATALGMTGADIAQNELGLTGEGVKVAVMDTGIDVDHPDLGGPGFPNSRVVAGYDLVGDDYNAASSNPDRRVPHPDAVPDDCQGHGTHVAGIVGANAEGRDGGITGVAPGVSFGAYRVFGCEGSTDADIMVAAMERALADDMDVLNMSIGSAYSWPSYPTATASDRLVDRGMVVVASIGNSGASGLYSAGAPGLGEKVIGVASFDNTHVTARSVVANPSGAAVPYLGLGNVAAPPTEGTTDPLVDAGTVCPSVGIPLEADVAGKTALIARGSCTFEEKYATAAAAGATAVVIYNSSPGLFSGGGVVDRDIPGIGIPQAEGKALAAELAAGAEVTLTWTADEVSTPSPTGGRISSFSSYGLSPDLALKPDIGAPGGNINSTLPLEQGGHGVNSGTSMASPHVAGAVALLLEAKPGLRAWQVRDVLQNSADPAEWSGAPGAGYLDNAHRQGAGMLDIPGVVQAGATVRPAKLALGESDTRTGGTSTKWVTVRNTTRETVTYTVSHAPALATYGNTFAPSFADAYADVSFSRESVTLRPGGSATVGVTVTAPEATDADQLIYGGYVVVTADDGTAYSVPYAGYAGDYQAIDPITPVMSGGEVVADLPSVATITACAEFINLDCIDPQADYELLPDGGTYTLGTVDGLPDVPYTLVHFQHQVEKLQVTVLDAATGRPVDRRGAYAVDVTGVERNETAGGFTAYAWDGSYTTLRGDTKSVPDGDYVLSLKALKADGESWNPEHWETWTSPTITIDRP